MLAGTKFAEYYYQVPSMKLDSIHETLYQLDQMKMIALTIACMAGIGWFVPDLSAASMVAIPSSNQKTKLR